MHNLFLIYLVCLLSWMDLNPSRTKDVAFNRIISTNCCIHTVVPPDDGPRYARNMKGLAKYTKNKLCIKLVFHYTITTDSTYKKVLIIIRTINECKWDSIKLTFFTIFKFFL
jgi:hypothetical protein